MRSSWRVWSESLSGTLLGMPLSFSTHSQALAHAVKHYRDGDSGRTVKTFVVSDTGTKAREYRLHKNDTGHPGKEYGADLGKIERVQAKAYKANWGINQRDE